MSILHITQAVSYTHLYRMMYTLTVHFTNTIHIIIMLKCYVNNTIFEQFFNKDIVYINEQKEKTMGDNKLVRALGLKEADVYKRQDCRSFRL